MLAHDVSAKRERLKALGFGPDQIMMVDADAFEACAFSLGAKFHLEVEGFFRRHFLPRGKYRPGDQREFHYPLPIRQLVE